MTIEQVKYLQYHSLGQTAQVDTKTLTTFGWFFLGFLK
jgi:hypothetical protein